MSHRTLLSLLAAMVLVFATAADAQSCQPPAGAFGEGAPAAGQRDASRRAENQRAENQNADHRPPKGPPTRELTELLGLNPAQTDALDNAMRERHQQMQAQRQRADEARDAAKNAFDARVRKLLTPEQYGKFKQWEVQHRPPHGPPHGGPDGGRRPPPRDDGARPESREG